MQGLDDAPEEQAQPSGFKKEGSALAIEDAKSAPAESQALSDKEWEEAKGLLQQSKDAMGKLLKAQLWRCVVICGAHCGFLLFQKNTCQDSARLSEKVTKNTDDAVSLELLLGSLLVCGCACFFLV